MIIIKKKEIKIEEYNDGWWVDTAASATQEIVELVDGNGEISEGLITAQEHRVDQKLDVIKLFGKSNDTDGTEIGEIIASICNETLPNKISYETTILRINDDIFSIIIIETFQPECTKKEITQKPAELKR